MKSGANTTKSRGAMMENSSVSERVRIVLEQIGERVTKGAYVGLEQAAEAVADVAVLHAPMDTGALKDAIRVEEVLGGEGKTGRDARGRFARKSFAVYIDKSVINPRTGEHPSDYGEGVEEHMAPYGTGKWGHVTPFSESQGVDVGGRFMARASKEMQGAAYQMVADSVRKALKGKVRIKVTLKGGKR